MLAPPPLATADELSAPDGVSLCCLPVGQMSTATATTAKSVRGLSWRCCAVRCERGGGRLRFGFGAIGWRF